MLSKRTVAEALRNLIALDAGGYECEKIFVLENRGIDQNTPVFIAVSIGRILECLRAAQIQTQASIIPRIHNWKLFSLVDPIFVECEIDCDPNATKCDINASRNVTRNATGMPSQCDIDANQCESHDAKNPEKSMAFDAKSLRNECDADATMHATSYVVASTRASESDLIRSDPISDSFTKKSVSESESESVVVKANVARVCESNATNMRPTRLCESRIWWQLLTTANFFEIVFSLLISKYFTTISNTCRRVLQAFWSLRQTVLSSAEKMIFLRLLMFLRHLNFWPPSAVISRKSRLNFEGGAA